jgi:hypothetical protein
MKDHIPNGDTAKNANGIKTTTNVLPNDKDDPTFTARNTKIRFQI